MGEVSQFDFNGHRLEIAEADQLLELSRQVALSGLKKVLSAEEWVGEETYSHSLRLLEEVGQDLVEGNDSPEAQVRIGLLRENVFSSIIEMLHTDKENRGKLENNRERKYVIHDGHVLSMDGVTPIRTLCANGAASAAQRADIDKRMVPVAERTAADERNAEAVDNMPVGHARFGFSNYLKEAMDRYGTKYYDDLGNREFLGFIQWYYRVDEHTMIGASYSVDSCDIKNVRDMWQAFGGHIPEGLETPTWLDCAIQLQCTEEQARNMALAMRKNFYERRGVAHVKHYSVDEFMEINKEAADQMFELYLDLARAYYRRQKSGSVHAMVDGLLKDPKGLSHEVRAQLRGIYQKDSLNRHGAALIEQLIRYATTERLREGLSLLGTEFRPTVQVLTPPAHLSRMEQLQFLARQAAPNILAGARAGRTYGGCTMAINLSENPDPNTYLDSQGAFGGVGQESSVGGWGKSEACVYIHSGCYCCPYDDRGNPLSEPMKVPAKKRPGIVTCMRDGCGAYMLLDQEGNPRKGPNSIVKGQIYETAQRKIALQQKEQEVRQLASTVLQPHVVPGMQEKIVGARQGLETANDQAPASLPESSEAHEAEVLPPVPAMIRPSLTLAA